MAEITFKDITKTYNPGLFKKKVGAVKGLGFEVRRGEVFGLIGPNGAGKSTTIRLLLGLTRPDSGTILFRGTPLKGGAIQGEAGYLPENPYLYDHLTMQELLEFCGKASGMASADIVRRTDFLLEQTSMNVARRRPLRTFSKGMLQRAGICFALLHDPSVVILDEPMSGLDPIGRKMVLDLVLELKAQGKTVFFCSHILSDVERLCDRIGILVGGRLVTELSREDFEEREELPVHLGLGPMNDRQRAAVRALAGELREDGAGATLSLSSDHLDAVSKGLAEAGVKVTGTLGQRVSLESVFVQAVKEVQS